MNDKLILLGGGGHCKSVLDTIISYYKYKEIIVVDKNEHIGQQILVTNISACDDDLEKLYNDGYGDAFITIGDNNIRKSIHTKLCEIGYNIPNIIDKTAVISSSTQLSAGIFVGKNVIINAECTMGNGIIINSGAIVEHDCHIDAFSHIAPGAVLCGGVTIGELSHIGANCSVKQSVKIGRNTIIGMGSIVVNDISDGVLAYGCPCREVSKI